jgi:drug/metabolite transporter (DMT)-like permease
MLASALCFGLMALFTRMLPAVPSMEKVFFRSLIGLILTAVLFVVCCRPRPRPQDIAGLIWRGVFGSLALICYFFAIDRCGVAKATLYCYAYPLWATLVAWIELGERPSRRAIGASVIALAGVAVTLDLSTRTGITRLSHADAVGLLSGVLMGAAMVSVRRLRANESSWWIVMFFMATGVLFSVPSTLFAYRPPARLEWLLIILMSLTAAAAQLLMTTAYRFVTATEGSVLSLTVIPWSTLFAVICLGEVQPLRFWTGAALVFGAVVWLVCEQSTAGASAQGGSASVR